MEWDAQSFPACTMPRTLYLVVASTNTNLGPGEADKIAGNSQFLVLTDVMIIKWTPKTLLTNAAHRPNFAKEPSLYSESSASAVFEAICYHEWCR